MSKPNAVKFKAIVSKANLKEILMKTFDLEIQLTYPNLSTFKDEIPIRGICSLGSFEALVDAITPKDLDFLDKLRFQQAVNFRLVTISVEPKDLPAL